MHGEQLIQQLGQAERLIEQVFELISYQSELVKRLHTNGYDATEAQRVLKQFKELLGMHFADRDKLRELARSQKYAPIERAPSARD